MNKKDFKDYKISADILRSLEILNYTNPTKVQEKVIPLALSKKDIVVKSQTGSGKTASFAIPIIELIDWEEKKPQALVITPTRELAMQVAEDFFNIGRFKRIKVVPVYGKTPFYNQRQSLKQKTHVVVGTPGRIIDHLERGTLDVSMIHYLIIDEADEMFNMGFLEQIETILNKLPQNRMTMLFSATIPQDIEYLCKKHMNQPEYVEIEDEDIVVEQIEQIAYKVEEKGKMKLLKDVTIVENPESCIIFANTRQKVDQIHGELQKNNYMCNKIHGGMEQRDRTRVMEDFRSGSFRYLVATDVAARGIDVDSITHVINFDVPLEREPYVHRIGRTGRVGKTGKAITFVTPKDRRNLRNIEDFIGAVIPVESKPDRRDVAKLTVDFEDRKRQRPERKEAKGEELNKDIMKIHINAGRKTKMRPSDIVGTLSNLEGMTIEDIGIINITDTSTFVDILNGKGKMVLKELRSTKVKGRIRKVNRANQQIG
ncbi:MAG: DEAD/DEAH box helicase [Tissierellia bacterium]|nr:DEAD/DEAH box helicase [Tissierellia bacterium]